TPARPAAGIPVMAQSDGGRAARTEVRAGHVRRPVAYPTSPNAPPPPGPVGPIEIQLTTPAQPAQALSLSHPSQRSSTVDDPARAAPLPLAPSVVTRDSRDVRTRAGC